MTKNSRNCNRTFDYENVLIDLVGYGEEVQQEFFRQHKTSDLCDDCLLDEIVAKSQSIKTS